MSYKQSRNPNLGASATVSLCLQYVQNAFASGWAGPDAWTAWTQHVKHRHGNRNWPTGATYIPIWFSGTWNGHYYGHVAILNIRTGQVYTSPYYKTHGHEVYSSIEAMMNTFRGVMSDITYRGWSEDIGGTRVVESKGETMEIIRDVDNEWGRWRKLAQQIRGRDFSRAEFRAHAVGRTWLRAMETLSDNAEADRNQANAALGRLASKDKWQQQIYDLQARVKALGSRPTQAQLDAANAAVDKLSAQMRDAQAEATQARKDAAESRKNLEKIQQETEQAEKEASNFLTALINAVRKMFGK